MLEREEIEYINQSHSRSAPKEHSGVASILPGQFLQWQPQPLERMAGGSGQGCPIAKSVITVLWPFKWCSGGSERVFGT